MQGWQQFIAYEDATGVSFNEDSYIQFNLAEAVNEGSVRIEFTFDDASVLTEWWCLGIGESKDDTSIPYNHDFDNSKYWLKKGLGGDFATKKDHKIKKVTIRNWGTANVVTYKVIGGTICGTPMTIKNDNTKVFGYYGGEFSPTAQQKNIFKMMDFVVGDYQKLIIEFGVETPSGWALVAGGEPSDIASSITKKEITLTGANLSEFSIFNWSAGPDPINISGVYLYKEVSEIEAKEIYEAPAGTTDLNDVAGSYTELKINYPKEISGEAATLCGDGDGSNEAKTTNISAYDYLCFEITEVSGGSSDLRVWVWDGSKVVTLRPHPVADYDDVKDWTADYSIETAGTYAVKVSDYNKLKGAKTNWGSSATLTVSMAYMGKGTPVEYVPSGKYTLSGVSDISSSLTAALADPNAVYYDATGVLGTDVDLTSVTNPNALFKANSGALSNTNNVIIDGTCANLELSDGNYPFNAPYDFDADAVSYNRSFTVGQASTVCLPFALTQDECDDAGKFYELTAYDGATLTFTQITSGGTTAYKPYLFRAAKANPFSSYSDKEIGASSGAELSTTVGSGETATMTGTLAHQSVNGKYGWNSSDGVFSIATTDAVTIDPFRAYISIPGESLARVATLFIDSSVTGINEVSNSEDIKGVKNFEGKVFENGKIIIFKKGMKFNANGQLIK